MKIMFLLIVSSMALAQTRPTGKPNESTKRTPTTPERSNRATVPNMAAEEFQALYKCSWPQAEGRPVHRQFSCGEAFEFEPNVTVKNQKKCQPGVKKYCTGIVKCEPTDKLKALFKNEEEKKDPRYLNTQVEYSATCPTVEVGRYKSMECPTDATKCVYQDLSTEFFSASKWDKTRQEIIQQRGSR